jgi:ADP-ribose pyrophosphatase
MDTPQLAETVVRSQIVFECPIFQVEYQIIRRNDGSEAPRWIAIRPTTVSIIPIDEHGKCLLIRQYRSGSDTIEWRLVTGSIEPDETPVQCAKRELAEETGLSAENYELVRSARVPSGWVRQERICFVATKLTPANNNGDPNEVLEVHPLSREQVIALLADHALSRFELVCLHQVLASPLPDP